MHKPFISKYTKLPKIINKSFRKQLYGETYKTVELKDDILFVLNVFPVAWKSTKNGFDDTTQLLGFMFFGLFKIKTWV